MAAIPPSAVMSQHQPSPIPNNSQAPRQLEFNEAMKNFKTMFPSMDRDVIEAVLRANNGLVDATIDQLLDMGAKEVSNVDSNSSPHLPAYTALHPQEPPPSYSDVVSTVQAKTNTAASPPPRPLPARPYSAWNPPLLGALPDDFLRLTAVRCESQQFRTRPVSDRNINSTAAVKELEQFLEDEKMAMFLQNEEFMRELRRNEDFVLSLEKDGAKSVAPLGINEAQANSSSPPAHGHPYSAHSISPSITTPSPDRQEQVVASAAFHREVEDERVGGGAVGGGAVGAVGGRPTSPVAGHDDAAFREKLKHMGKSTRKKFDKLARVFSRRKHTQRENFLVTAGSSASTVNLLEDYEEDEDELITMGTGRLELMDERDEENTELDEKSNISKTNATSSQSGATNSVAVEPIVFFAEDNEFQFKDER